jgi:cold shock protein
MRSLPPGRERAGCCPPPSCLLARWFAEFGADASALSKVKGEQEFARPDGEDVFMHFSVIQMEGYRSLDEGQLVEFDVTQGPKGLQAANVRPMPHTLAP